MRTHLVTHLSPRTVQEQLAHWRTKAASNAREWDARNAALAREKRALAAHYGHLKARMDGLRAQLGERLRQLSANAQVRRGLLFLARGSCLQLGARSRSCGAHCVAGLRALSADNLLCATALSAAQLYPCIR